MELKAAYYKKPDGGYSPVLWNLPAGVYFGLKPDAEDDIQCVTREEKEKLEHKTNDDDTSVETIVDRGLTLREMKELYLSINGRNDLPSTTSSLSHAINRVLNGTVAQDILVKLIQRDRLIDFNRVVLWGCNRNKSLAELFYKVAPDGYSPVSTKELFIKYASGNFFQSDPSYTYTCQACRKRFEDELMLINHLNRTTSEITYMCKHCGYLRFTSICALVYHIFDDKAVGHCGEHCIICHQSFSSLSEHLTFYSRFVDGWRAQCNICSYLAFSKCSFNFHVASHIPQLPYICPECGAFFLFKSDLETHTNDVCYINRKQRFYFCAACHLICSETKHFSTHLSKEHYQRWIKCVICLEVFASQIAFMKHRSVNHPEAPNTYHIKHYCALCPNQTYRGNSVMKHFLGHLNDIKCSIMLYKCDCSYYTWRKDRFIQHIKSKNCSEIEVTSRPQIMKICQTCEEVKSFNGMEVPGFICEGCELKRRPNCKNIFYYCELCRVVIQYSWDLVLDHFHFKHRTADMLAAASFISMVSSPYLRSGQHISENDISFYDDITQFCKSLSNVPAETSDSIVEQELRDPEAMQPPTLIKIRSPKAINESVPSANQKPNHIAAADGQLTKHSSNFVHFGSTEIKGALGINKEIFYCKICFYTTCIKYEMTSHMLKDHKYTSCSCEFCGMVLPTYIALVEHMKVAHRVSWGSGIRNMSEVASIPSGSGSSVRGEPSLHRTSEDPSLQKECSNPKDSSTSKEPSVSQGSGLAEDPGVSKDTGMLGSMREAFVAAQRIPEKSSATEGGHKTGEPSVPCEGSMLRKSKTPGELYVQKEFSLTEQLRTLESHLKEKPGSPGIIIQEKSILQAESCLMEESSVPREACTTEESSMSGEHCTSEEFKVKEEPRSPEEPSMQEEACVTEECNMPGEAFRTTESTLPGESYTTEESSVPREACTAEESSVPREACTTEESSVSGEHCTSEEFKVKEEPHSPEEPSMQEEACATEECNMPGEACVTEECNMPGEAFRTTESSLQEDACTVVESNMLRGACPIEECNMPGEAFRVTESTLPGESCTTEEPSIPREACTAEESSVSGEHCTSEEFQVKEEPRSPEEPSMQEEACATEECNMSGEACVTEETFRTTESSLQEDACTTEESGGVSGEHHTPEEYKVKEEPRSPEDFSLPGGVSTTEESTLPKRACATEESSVPIEACTTEESSMPTEHCISEEFKVKEEPHSPEESSFQGEACTLEDSTLPGEACMAEQSTLPAEASTTKASTLPREACSTKESSMPGEACMTEESTLPGETGVTVESTLPGEASMTVESSMPGEAGVTVASTLPGEAGVSEESTLPGEAGVTVESTLPGEACTTEESTLPGEAGVTVESTLTREACSTKESTLPGEARIAEESFLPGEACLAEESTLPVEAGVTVESTLPGEADVTIESALPGEARIAEESFLPGEACLAEESTLPVEAGVMVESTLPGEACLVEESTLLAEACKTKESIMQGDTCMAEESILPVEVFVTEKSSMPGEACMTEESTLPAEACTTEESNLPGEAFLTEESSLPGEVCTTAESSVPGEHCESEERNVKEEPCSPKVINLQKSSMPGEAYMMDESSLLDKACMPTEEPNMPGAAGMPGEICVSEEPSMSGEACLTEEPILQEEPSMPREACMPEEAMVPELNDNSEEPSVVQTTCLPRDPVLVKEARLQVEHSNREATIRRDVDFSDIKTCGVKRLRGDYEMGNVSSQSQPSPKKLKSDVVTSNETLPTFK